MRIQYSLKTLNAQDISKVRSHLKNSRKNGYLYRNTICVVKYGDKSRFPLMTKKIQSYPKVVSNFKNSQKFYKMSYSSAV